MCMSKFLKFWFPVIGYSGIIFYVSSLPDLQVPIPGRNVDKVFHLLEFTPFGYMLARAIGQEKDAWPAVKLMIWVTFLSALYALSDEFHQLFVIGRSSSLLDAAADSLGGCLGAWFFVRNRQRSSLKMNVKERGC